MAKLRSTPIESEDLVDYLDGHSDFSFELKVLKLLRDAKFDCEHGGHYTDPVTKKSREFDIRARYHLENLHVRLSVECKNVRDNFPVLLSRLPRTKEESFNHVCILYDEPEPQGLLNVVPYDPFRSRAKSTIFKAARSPYPIGSPCGKSITQVGRVNDGSISSGDSEIYDKWGQSLNSISDLVSEMVSDGKSTDQKHFSICLPILVFPDDRMWAVDYDHGGNLVSAPKRIDRCSFFVGQTYSIGITGPSYGISHLELFTFSGLKNFIDAHMTDRENLSKLFLSEIQA